MPPVIHPQADHVPVEENQPKRPGFDQIIARHEQLVLVLPVPRKLVEHLEALHVRNARAHGWPWQAIADALGVTRQAVHQKHHRTRD